MRSHLHELAFAGVLLALGCSGGGSDGVDAGAGVFDAPAAQPDANPTAPTFRTETLTAVGAGGYQTTLAVRGTKVALATLSQTTSTTQCTVAGRAPQTVPAYDLWYAESSGAAFATRKVTTEGYLSLMGVGLALDSAGTASVAYTGGPNAEQRCGASDLMLRQGTSAGFGAGTTLATGSQSNVRVPDQASNCVQDVCNSGDATGYWPAIGFRPAGSAANTMAVAFRDLHFGWAADDFQSSDVEFLTPGPSITTIDVSRGGGAYARIGFAPNGDAIVAHYNGERASAQGIWVHRETAGSWSARRVTTARAGEQLGFAVAPSGRMSLAYYDPDNVKLVYLESTDGTTWSAPEDVSTDGITGQYPALAIDGAGEPAIAYYRCNDYQPTNRSCDRGKDGLYLARRSGGTWSSYPVVATAGAMEGYYPALGFLGGKAVVAYQVRTFDPGTGTTTYRLDVSWED